MLNPDFRRSPTLRGLVLATLALITSCHPCYDDVCHHALAIAITEPGGGPLQEGQYIFDLTVDGTPATATCDIGPGGGTATCSQLGAGALSTPLRGSASNPHERFHLYWEPTVPKSLTIHVEHDGVVVLDSSFDPAYKPVDEACYEDCDKASESFELTRS